MTDYDLIILGGGLAGTTLAWQALWNGNSVCLIDRNETVTSSKIAAGLMTPITGQRLVRNERWEQLLETAQRFYRRVEAALGEQFLKSTGMVRIFADAREKSIFLRRQGEEFRGLVRDPEPPLNADWFAMPFGCFEMPTACQLLCDRYLKPSRDSFVRSGNFLEANINLAEDIVHEAKAVILPRLNIRGRSMVLCQGIEEKKNIHFQVPWQAAKGEILTIRIADLNEDRIVNRGVWLARLNGDLYRAGSSYEWEELNNIPTTSKREEICLRLKEFLKLPFEVIDHHAAVRPILRDQKPVVSTGYINGLGSKGALYAPWCAERLIDHMESGVRILADISLDRFRKIS